MIRFRKHPDIADEFAKWIIGERDSKFKDSTLNVQGFTANSIAAMSSVDLPADEVFIILAKMRETFDKGILIFPEELLGDVLEKNIKIIYEYISSYTVIRNQSRNPISESVRNNARIFTETFEQHADIAEEFARWIKMGQDSEYGGAYLKVNGYTAKDIKRLAPFMNPYGVFSFLVTLREEPDLAKQYIAEGFRIL